MYVPSSFTYSLANVILTLPQSDHIIKRRPLYYNNVIIFVLFFQIRIRNLKN
jgi:hypothetical protein